MFSYADDTIFFFFSDNVEAGENPQTRNRKYLECLKSSCSWLCGLQTSSSTQLSSEDEQHQALTSITEDPRVNKFLNANLVLVVAVGIGLFAYFSVNPFPEGFDPSQYVTPSSSWLGFSFSISPFYQRRDSSHKFRIKSGCKRSHVGDVQTEFWIQNFCLNQVNSNLRNPTITWSNCNTHTFFAPWMNCYEYISISVFNVITYKENLGNTLYIKEEYQ